MAVSILGPIHYVALSLRKCLWKWLKSAAYSTVKYKDGKWNVGGNSAASHGLLISEWMMMGMYTFIFN